MTVKELIINLENEKKQLLEEVKRLNEELENMAIAKARVDKELSEVYLQKAEFEKRLAEQTPKSEWIDDVNVRIEAGRRSRRKKTEPEQEQEVVKPEEV